MALSLLFFKCLLHLFYAFIGQSAVFDSLLAFMVVRFILNLMTRTLRIEIYHWDDTDLPMLPILS